MTHDPNLTEQLKIMHAVLVDMKAGIINVLPLHDSLHPATSIALGRALGAAESAMDMLASDIKQAAAREAAP